MIEPITETLIRELLKHGTSQRKIAIQLGISRNTVNKVVASSDVRSAPAKDSSYEQHLAKIKELFQLCEGNVVRADVTVTIAAPKLGLLLPGALEVVGNVEVVDIGIPPELEDSETEPIDLITGDDVGNVMNRREQTSH